MSVRTETHVSQTDETGIESNTLDDVIQPPLIVEGEMDPNKTQEIIQSVPIVDEGESISIILGPLIILIYILREHCY